MSGIFAMKVVYIPGILGSNLGVYAGDPPLFRTIWIDPSVLVAGGIRYLQLAPDGVSPGPLAQGQVLQAFGVFAPVYSPMAVFMRAVGWEVLELGWDWRTSVLTAGRAAWPVVRQWAAGEPFSVVAHSLGGLVARAIYGQMVAAGAAAQLARLVTLGTPHYGSFEAVRCLQRLPLLYRGLVALAGWTEWIAGTPGPAVLDAAIASMPSWYELAPFRASGPLFDDAPEQAARIYTADFYRNGNPFVDAELIRSAELVQTELVGMVPEGRVFCIAGIGYDTSYQLDQAYPPETEAGYKKTADGDGTVTLAEATLAGAPIFSCTCEHSLLLLSPISTGLVYSLISA